MEDKIELYKDILKNEPFSRVFYPLSIALKEKGALKEAVYYLEQGLLYHTNFLEARMLFVEVLDLLGEQEKQHREIEHITEIFKKYPRFWEVWAEKEQNSNEDIALALSFVAHAFRNNAFSLRTVFATGLQSLSGVESTSWLSTAQQGQHISTEAPNVYELTNLQSSRSFSEPIINTFEDEHLEDSLLEDVEEDSLSDTGIHTRSMADLLAEQGELDKAIVIYRELLLNEVDADVKAELKFLIQEFEARLEEDTQADIPEQTTSSNKEKLINTLATLVSRLDARAEAIQTRI